MNQQQAMSMVNMMQRAYGAIAAAGMLAVLVAAAIPLTVMILYLLTLQRALSRCSPDLRTMQPGMVWLSLIPCFNLVWQFFIVINLGKSLEAEFKKRGIAAEERPGQTVGLAMCILYCCSIIPLAGCATSVAGIVCWIIYWVKISGFSAKLADQSAVA
jgi:hypothetical protein